MATEGEHHDRLERSLLSLLDARQQSMRTLYEMDMKQERMMMQGMCELILKDIASMRNEIALVKKDLIPKAVSPFKTDTSPVHQMASSKNRAVQEDSGRSRSGSSEHKIAAKYELNDEKPSELRTTRKRRRRFSYAELNSELPVDSDNSTPEDPSIENELVQVDSDDSVLNDATFQESKDPKGVKKERREDLMKTRPAICEDQRTDEPEDRTKHKSKDAGKESSWVQKSMKKTKRRPKSSKYRSPTVLDGGGDYSLQGIHEAKEEQDWDSVKYTVSNSKADNPLPELSTKPDQSRRTSTPMRSKSGEALRRHSSDDGHRANTVVRKKAEREHLKGGDCRECRQHWELLGNGDIEKQERLKQLCSKHRYAYEPPLTPEHWNAVSFAETHTQPP